MTTTEMSAIFADAEARAGQQFPDLIPGWLVADLAESIGVPWIRKNGETWTKGEIVREFARRINA
jgi:hypothetical protein